MTLTLAVDCSMRWLNLGLADNGKLYGEENINAGRAQAELLPGAAEGFLRRHGFSLGEVGRIAVTVGPGYYTGVRVGLSYATALAEGLGVEVAPLTSLYALAYPSLRSGLIAAPVLKARKGCVYGAIYGSGGEKNMTPAFFEAADFVELLRSLGCRKDEIALIGADVDEFDELKNSGYRIIPSSPAIGLALAEASLAIEGRDPAAIRAEYARDPD
jgi:tRNA threonylcarbamoyladenosine biosynthesis protein TsaB